MPSKHGKSKFTLEFKQDAARLVIEKGYTPRQAAESLGVSLSAIKRWVQAERLQPAGKGSKRINLSLVERDELIKLRKENANLLMEREILKKAALFFAKENGQHNCNLRMDHARDGSIWRLYWSYFHGEWSVGPWRNICRPHSACRLYRWLMSAESQHLGWYIILTAEANTLAIVIVNV